MKTTKNILMTGASRGIGRLATMELLARGHRVFAGMRDPQGANKGASAELTAWAEGNGTTMDIYDLDVTDETGIQRAVSAIEAEHPIDVLVNNAGLMPVGITEAYSPAAIKSVMDVNFMGAIRCARAVLPAMRDRKSGLLINVSSTAGRLAIPYFGIYCASKWALEAYSETLHYELQDSGVQSILVEPGGHATDLIKTTPAPDERSRAQSYGDANEGPGRMIQMFEDMFAKGEAINDARNVATAIADLVDADGDVPLRTTVGMDMGLIEINRSTASPQADLMRQLGFTPATAGT